MSFLAEMQATYAQEDAEREAFSAVRYTGGDCPNCGRERMEELTNGRVVCEKCHWEPAANDYCSEHRRWHP